MGKKIIVVSAVNLVDGGPLTVLRDCIRGFSQVSKNKDVTVYFLISNLELVSDLEVGNIKFLCFPKSKKSWFYRLYYEFLYFKKLSKKLGPVHTWFSLHDITPNVDAKYRYVYCHNPSVFLRLEFLAIFQDLKQYLFSKFYKYLYGININRNTAVVVQQQWFGDFFKDTFSVDVLVSKPDISSPNAIGTMEKGWDLDKTKINLFYPAFPRYFKNHDLIVEMCEKSDACGIQFYFTLSGFENKTSKKVFSRARNLDAINFLGLMSHENTLAFMHACDALVFPSKMETWGLPITEAISFGKPILVPDLPYAHETVGDYDKALWFNPENIESLYDAVIRLKNKSAFDLPKPVDKKYKEVNGWDNLVVALVSK